MHRTQIRLYVTENTLLATPGGLEPPTPDLEGPCSIQLSYEAALRAR